MPVHAEDCFAILETKETIFFSHQGDRLRQWIIVTIKSRLDRAVRGTVTIQAGGEEALTPLEIVPGVREYRCYAPTLWPARPPVAQAPVRLTVGEHTGLPPADLPPAVYAGAACVGHHRPWTVYLLSDVCTDYTWVYDSVQAVHADDAALTEAEIALAEVTENDPEANRNHYNFVHAREAAFYLERYPDQAERLFDHLRRGTVTLNPLFNMCLTGDVSLEELIRQFYPARAWAIQHGLDIGYANHQETPTIAWVMAAVLAGSGIRHLVKSVLPYECPWAARLEEPPIFVWEGPDGSRVLVRRRNQDYVEGNFVLRDLRATDTALHDTILPDYERLGERYPFDAIALVGCYGDLSPHSQDLAAKKAATIAAYNAQGWEYPKLVNASHKQFWDDVERQIAARTIQVPVYRGDHGASWEAWPASLAYDFAAWRRAQERAGTTDKLVAILACLNDGGHQARRTQLARGWANLIYLADHAWNGANDANRALNASLRRQWQTAANGAFDALIADGLAILSQRIATSSQRISESTNQQISKSANQQIRESWSGTEDRIMVFNGLGWPRTGMVRVAESELAPHPTPLPVGERETGFCLIDVATGEPVPAQVVEENGQPVLWFEARDVPPIGYRVFANRKSPIANRKSANQQISKSSFSILHPPDWETGSYRLEGPLYAVEVSPTTGGIVSLYDKVRGKELVDPDSPYHLNQCLYLSEGVEHTPQAASVEVGSCGSVFGQLIVHAALKNTTVTTTITLYTSLDHVDIRNEVEKLPTTEKQELDFAFPFQVPGRQYRFEAPGAIVAPGADQRPGAGQAVTAVRHFVDVFNDEFGVTLSQADSGLVEFGHRTTAEDPLEPDPGNSTILALALENCLDWHEAVRDQAGVTRFVFRYSLRGHAGGFDPAAAVRFGWEDNNELLAVALPGGQTGDLPPDKHAFLEVKPDNVVLTSLKITEEEGLIVRLWECAGRATTAVISASGLGSLRTARQTDLLERDTEPLAVTDGKVHIPIQARGLATVRLLF